jgi:hypothetical protein
MKVVQKERRPKNLVFVTSGLGERVVTRYFTFGISDSQKISIKNVRNKLDVHEVKQ